MGGVDCSLPCLGAEISLLADLAIVVMQKLVSGEPKNGITASKMVNFHLFLVFCWNSVVPKDVRCRPFIILPGY